MRVFRAAEEFRRLAGCVPKQFQAVANGAYGATVVACDLRYGQPPNAIESEDRKDARRLGRAFEAEAIEEVPGGVNIGVWQVIRR